MLGLIVVEANEVRGRAALALAASAAALGREVAVLFDGPSVALLAALPEELATAQALGAKITACATGLADLGVAAPAGTVTGGMVGFLAAIGDTPPVVV